MLFDSVTFNKEYSVHIIGCGAIGSRIALDLVRLGVKNIHAYDFDKVEEHNLRNQAFIQGDIGLLKVDALRALADDIRKPPAWDIQNPDVNIFPHVEKLTTLEEMRGAVVFLAVDSLDTRKELMNTFHYGVYAVFDTRIGTNHGRVYAWNQTMEHRRYMDTLVPDSEVLDDEDRSACGRVEGVGATAGFAASLAIWQMIRWARFVFAQSSTKPEFETIFSLDPLQVVAMR